MENKMTNQERLEEYLVGTNGYLKSDISNSKVIMLSGKWGSGKTHFWKNIIATEIFEKELKEKRKSYAYISLYGKNTIESIQNDLLYNSYEFIANPSEKVSKFFSVFTYYSQYSPEKISSGIIKGITDLKNKFEFKKAESYLSDGGIICFDDFERKSKDIDLNDLFGFITNLTIEFKSKVVIILNDDVFEGEEKKIFSRVKEKSVSKFLKYEPKIEELFNLIFDLEIEKDGKKEKKYKDLEPYKQIILKTIQEAQELNARIYIQVLDNLVEWIEKKQEIDDNVLRCLILVNIYFILYHTIFYKQERSYLIKDFNDKFELDSNNFDSRTYFQSGKTYEPIPYETVEKYLNYLEKRILIGEQIDINKKYIEDNKKLYESKFFANNFDISKNVDEKTFQKINNFIETGILINE